MTSISISENELKFSKFNKSSRTDLWFGVAYPDGVPTWYLNYCPIETKERGFGIQIGPGWTEEQADEAMAYAESINRYMEEVKKDIIETHEYWYLIPTIKRFFYHKWLGLTLWIEDVKHGLRKHKW